MGRGIYYGWNIVGRSYNGWIVKGGGEVKGAFEWKKGYGGGEREREKKREKEGRYNGWNMGKRVLNGWNLGEQDL
jgi:hypothetical protein